VVTGSTDGIGKEFALQLGRAGFNVLLVARNAESLKKTAEEIGTYHGKGITKRTENSLYRDQIPCQGPKPRHRFCPS